MFRPRNHGRAASYWPWTYLRKGSVEGLPGPGSQNLAYTTLALPKETPIGDGNANASQWWFQRPLDFASHLVGVNGLGGLQVQDQFGGGGPLTVTQPVTQNTGATVTYYPG